MHHAVVTPGQNGTEPDRTHPAQAETCPVAVGGKMVIEQRRQTHPLHLLEQQRNVVDSLRDDVRYLIHAQSLAQSGIYLQIWANGKSKCTATLKDAFAAPPVNALSVQTRARSLKHCAPHARSSWTSLRCSSSATACGLSAESNTVQLMPRCTGWIWPGSKAPPSIATSSGMCLRRRCRSMNSGVLSKKTSASATG